MDNFLSLFYYTIKHDFNITQKYTVAQITKLFRPGFSKMTSIQYYIRVKIKLLFWQMEDRIVKIRLSVYIHFTPYFSVRTFVAFYLHQFPAVVQKIHFFCAIQDKFAINLLLIYHQKLKNDIRDEFSEQHYFKMFNARIVLF